MKESVIFFNKAIQETRYNRKTSELFALLFFQLKPEVLCEKIQFWEGGVEGEGAGVIWCSKI